jgi:hypothetical protein
MFALKRALCDWLTYAQQDATGVVDVTFKEKGNEILLVCCSSCVNLWFFLSSSASATVKRPRNSMKNEFQHNQNCFFFFLIVEQIESLGIDDSVTSIVQFVRRLLKLIDVLLVGDAGMVKNFVSSTNVGQYLLQRLNKLLSGGRSDFLFRQEEFRCVALILGELLRVLRAAHVVRSTSLE